MPHSALRQAQVDRARPRRQAYSLRDPELRGFGVRIAPSGRKRFFLQVQHDGIRTWHDCGDAATMPVAVARAKAAAVRAGLRGSPDAAPLPFEVVADEVFQRYGRRWKPRTLAVNRGYCRKHILPWFRGTPVAAVTGGDVRAWFASLRATPTSADRALPVLSVILRQAEIYGYRPEGSNPCHGIRRYRRRGRERFLGPEELRRLGAALDRHARRRPIAAAAIRLLLLTGCRKSEILDLQWTDYREGKLFLRDSKTGPRTVWLAAPSRQDMALAAALGRRCAPPRLERRVLG